MGIRTRADLVGGLDGPSITTVRGGPCATTVAMRRPRRREASIDRDEAHALASRVIPESIDDYATLIDRYDQRDVRVVTVLDDDYPANLRQVYNRPPRDAGIQRDPHGAPSHLLTERGVVRRGDPYASDGKKKSGRVPQEPILPSPAGDGARQCGGTQACAEVVDHDNLGRASQTRRQARNPGRTAALVLLLLPPDGGLFGRGLKLEVPRCGDRRCHRRSIRGLKPIRHRSWLRHLEGHDPRSR